MQLVLIVRDGVVVGVIYVIKWEETWVPGENPRGRTGLSYLITYPARTEPGTWECANTAPSDNSMGILLVLATPSNVHASASVRVNHHSNI